MDKKKKQRDRMIRVFIDAAKEIIEKDGVQSLSARNVGDVAGYSYATIYNYFKDMKELAAYCAFDYLKDCYEKMISIGNDQTEIVDIIIEQSLFYFNHFSNKPNQFHLIFIDDLGDYPEKMSKVSEGIDVGLLLKKQLSIAAEDGYINNKDIDVLHQLIGSSIHGKLLYMLRNREAIPKSFFEEVIRRELNFMFQRSSSV